MKIEKGVAHSTRKPGFHNLGGVDSVQLSNSCAGSGSGPLAEEPPPCHVFSPPPCHVFQGVSRLKLETANIIQTTAGIYTSVLC